jgi:phosphopantothenoylcysteine decarboxylase/phosphopantothenate--cysteine ligase
LKKGAERMTLKSIKTRIIFGMTGGIACYKAADIISGLKQKDFDVFPILTKNAEQFITPLTLKTLSGNEVNSDLFKSHKHIPHISLANECRLMIIAPATANIIAKMANGICDDLLSTLYLAFKGPVVVIPAMNYMMWNHPATQRNIRLLREYGVHVMEPDEGRLASGEKGKGRFPEKKDVMLFIEKALFTRVRPTAEKSALEKPMNIIVTCGPTVEKIDPVRYISNFSSGRMGLALAEWAFRFGHNVKLISGRISAGIPKVIPNVTTESAEDMERALKKELDTNGADLLVMNSAVGDFIPESFSQSKIKKRDGMDRMVLPLKKNRDILKNVKSSYSDLKILGFALETDNIIENGIEKMKRKGMDYIGINSSEETMGKEEGRILLMDAHKKRSLEVKGKKDIMAREILEAVIYDNWN